MQKLEQVESFGALLDFLSNPDEYKQLVKDVRAAAKEYKELVENKRNIKNIDAWRASEGARLGKVEAALKVREEACTADSLKVQEDAKAVTARSGKNSRALTERTKGVDQREKDVGDLEKHEAKLVKLEAKYKAKLADIAEQEKELKRKFAEIAAVAGG